MAQSIAVSTTPFNWEGMDSNGKKIKGKSVAANEAAVRAQLRRRGVVPSKVRKESKLFQKSSKIKPADIAIFSRQLSTMLTAGIPLVQAFDIVGSGHDNPGMQRLIFAIKADVEGGSTLADSLARHPLYFDVRRR
jgi:type IV pilus assembly protein PilC